MKLKSQKGSITIFVLIALLFYTAFLLLMYAANTNKFKTISEKSDILKGIYEKNTDSDSINNIYNRKMAESIILPAEYQQVEYLESTGTQYIVTNTYPSSNLTTYVKQRYTQISKNCSVLGCRQSAQDDRYWINYDDVFEAGFGNWYRISNDASTSVDIDNEIVFNLAIDGLHKFIYKVGNNTYTKILNEVVYSEPKQSIILFGRNDRGNYTISPQRIYYVRFKEGGKIINNFVPSYRKLDSKPGLYDLVENKFYTNQGTGEFVVGPDVD